ncbi:MAG: AdoMet-dependent rRNA methyltransferase spb1 [Sclerophora amabilis]|nr:MAG: AdoMet-dependent rRNA methyltransferase spb1 [Sclerophora amabilis]
MGLQKKHGKGRLDKWYKLAKEKGYRARAAFKLIQLNKKYNFLEKSKVLIDLCAAPGSWCQVASETMPVNSLIIGVDLAPIKPIPRAITFQGDITTDKCRATIRQHLKSWKADTVLHDGAPNVGTAWVQDAFTQAELVLQSMKLATDFLAEGGTFVTKIFRSKDYNSLLWVFNQLFTKVEATKPPSSRNVSAEIFVVCRGFKAPKRIDPKFLDPRSVFAELADPTPNNEAKVFNPEKKKRKRDGYEEGDYTQYKEVPASEFIQTTDPIAMLGSLNRLSFEQKSNGDVALAALDKLPDTTEEIRQCCADLRVLGRKEFRSLLRWRLKVRDKFGFSSKAKAVKEAEDEEVAEVEPMDEELQIQEELQRLNENETSRKKRERRKGNERKQRELTRMQLQMAIPTDIGLEQSGPNGEDSMFALKAVDKAGAVGKLTKGKMIVPQSDNAKASAAAEDERRSDSDPESDAEEDQLEHELDSMYEQYQSQKSEADAKYRAKKARTETHDGEWEGISANDQSSESEAVEEESSNDESGDEVDSGDTNALIRSTGAGSVGQNGLTRRAAQFFDQDIFKDIQGLDADTNVEDDNSSSHDIASDEDLQGVNEINSDTSVEDEGRTMPRDVDQRKQSRSETNKPQAFRSEDLEHEEEIGDEFKADQVEGGEQGKEVSEGEDDGGFEVVKTSMGDAQWEEQEEPRKNGRMDIDIITAEAMTLAQKIATGESTKHDLLDESFNKYTFRDRDGLPEWFLDDENRHSKLNRPVSAAGAAAIKEKLRALNARPIKKVREAKDRKKFKAAQRLEKLRKKSALMVDDDGMTEKDKAQSIAKLMSKATKKKPKKQVSLVVAKGGNRGISGRPRGVKGKYKIVDSRLKKDVRAEKRLAKKRK